ncbi:hypothetical protein J4402_04205 [Candidatus Pacearchaeota archaeon]|nr:hypothetical protein [Candidatus Pacearchaeota archaeon]
MKKSVLVIFGVLFLICLGSFVSAIGLTPIARWDVVPYQRINAGETLNLGVVAFSKEGIDRVEFIISGQGYSGGMKTATEMSLNPQTGVWEYWVPLSASEFSSDGVINVEAVVYGRDGGVRDKNWIVEGTFGQEGYALNCWTDNITVRWNYVCNVTSQNGFPANIWQQYIIFYQNGRPWWTGVRKLIRDYNETTKTINFPYAVSWGNGPQTFLYEPKNGDHFIIGGGIGIDPLTINVNPTGNLPQPKIWVAPNEGSDSWGISGVNNNTKNFATIGKAIDTIRQWRSSNGYGNNADGGIVILNPGIHNQSSGGVNGFIQGENEWVTITSNKEIGGNRENTILQGYGWTKGIVQTRFNKVEGITIKNVNGNVFASATLYHDWYDIWVDNCNLTGYNKFIEESHPIDQSIRQWYTSSSFIGLSKAVYNSEMARNVYLEGLGDDVFVRTPFVVNALAKNIDPRDGTCVEQTCNHADCWQWFGIPVPHNSIVYNFDCINSSYQGIFARSHDGGSVLGKVNPPAEGMALVNFHTLLTPDAYGAENAWYISTNHMLMWHNTYNADFNFWNDPFSEFGGGDKAPLNIVNFSVKGNLFDNVELNAPLGDDNGGLSRAPGVDVLGWADNHYIDNYRQYYSEWPGTGNTTGDPGIDEYGNPNSTSVLLNRINPLIVPIDADNNLRVNGGDVGAYEFISESLPMGNCEIKKAYWRLA